MARLNPLIRLRCLRLLAWLALLAGGGAGASGGLTVSLGDIQAPGWSASGVRASIDLRQPGGLLRIKRLVLPAPVGAVEAVEISCRTGRLTGPELSCEGGRFRLRHPALGAERFEGDLYYRRADGQLRLSLRGLPLAQGRLDLRAQGSGRQWRIRGTGTALDVARVQQLLPVRAPVSAAGATDARFELRLQGEALSGGIELALRQLQLSDPAGKLATEGLELALSVKFRGDARALAFQARLRAPQGQLYLEPVFIDAGKHPFTLTGQGRWRDGVLDLAELRLEQPSAVTALGHLRYSLAEGLQEAGLFLRDARVGPLYELYLQPFLIGTALDDLAAGGALQGRIDWAGDGPGRVDLRLREVALRDRRGRFALEGVSGRLDWRPRPLAGKVAISELAWRSGELRGIGIGAARLPVRAVGRDFALLEPVRIPMLDGALIVNRLEARDAGLPQMKLAFDGRLAPIDMRRFTQALGWPVFSGTLAGRLPSLSYQGGELTLGGQLEVEAFGGRIAVEGLRLREPFGAVPRLTADVRLRGLDLQAITDTFSFGRIEGRLDGDIEQLRLVNWQPAAFDARFYTPPDDRSRHRISQRAIENISSIGGGGAGALLSRGFLRFFESFSYDRIGLSCRLREDVCLMGGLAPAENGLGYYIVRGRLLPRVDVIGFQRQVSWPTLLEQIKSVTQSEGPVVR